MSLFFDVWTTNGFILVSDVKLTNDPDSEYMHKIIPAGERCKIRCAMVVCGDYPKICEGFFSLACNIADGSLRDIAKYFGEKWTKRYAGTNDYSAIHICGFESGDGKKIPQMWYWTNWDHKNNTYKQAKELQDDLNSFNTPNPNNNWMAVLARRVINGIKDEATLIDAYLKLHGLFFTWNGDERYWKSAASSVNAIQDLLKKQLQGASIEAGANLTGAALRFLITIGYYLKNNTVAASPYNEVDILILSENESVWVQRSNFGQKPKSLRVKISELLKKMFNVKNKNG